MNNEAAFPVAVPADWDSVQNGMSLRDYFAGQAITGLLARPSGEMPAEIAASFAYHFADAMIALNRKDGIL